MGRAVARRHRGKGTGAGVGRGRARGRLEPGRAPGAARAARLSRAPGNSVPRDVGRGGGHSAAARLDRRHLTQHTTDPRGARDLIRVRRARRGRVGDPGARQQILPALRHCQRDAQPHQLSRQLRDRLPGRSGAALPESSGGANRFPGRSQVVLGNGLVHRVRRHSRDPGAGAVREWNGRLHRDRVWPWPRLRPRARLQGEDVASPPGAQLPTVFGEVPVRKQLLDRDWKQQTRGFRAGYLLYPDELLGVREAAGYFFDSSVSAQYVLTNFPYFGFRRRALGSEHSKIVVVPVALDDSRGELRIRNFLTAGTVEQALRDWTEVIRANTENGAITCLLIHPTDVTYKLETERRLITANRREDTRIGDMGAVARFWRERARLRPPLERTANGDFENVLNLRRGELA